MRSVKKLFVALFALLVGLVFLYNGQKVDAAGATSSTPWVLTFDNGQIINVTTNQSHFTVRSTNFSVSYIDAKGNTSNAYFSLWRDAMGVVPVEKFVEDQAISNGETISYNAGGNLVFDFAYTEGVSQKFGSVAFLVDRPIASRINTNWKSDQEYYSSSVSFVDRDYPRDKDMDLIFTAYNFTTLKFESAYGLLHLEEEGSYVVGIEDIRKGEAVEYYFTIDRSAPQIDLIEWNYFVETPLQNDMTSNGVKIVYSDTVGIANMTYYYRPFSNGPAEMGTADSGHIFWRKGYYMVSVTDMIGNVANKSFTITQFDLITDPGTGGITVGTEVTMNGGAYGGRTMTVGYTRCIYLGANALSQSRLDYRFSSTNVAIATVSEYGTITAKTPGTVTILVTRKGFPNEVSKLDITVYAESVPGDIQELKLTTDRREVYMHNGSEVLAGLGQPGGTTIHVNYARALCIVSLAPSPLLSDYYWISSDPSVAITDVNGYVIGVAPGIVTVTCINKYNSKYMGVFSFIIL